MLGLMVRFMDETVMSNIRYISKDLFAPFTSQIKKQSQWFLPKRLFSFVQFCPAYHPLIMHRFDKAKVKSGAFC